MRKSLQKGSPETDRLPWLMVTLLLDDRNISGLTMII
jgi:hypothetical protein